jgi:hypothetical protein
MQPTSQWTGAPARGGFGSGLLAGLTPLARLVVIAAVAIGLTILSRSFTTGQGFFFEQRVAVIVLAVGLLAAFALYAVSCVGALRQVGAWQRSGEAAKAAGALWALGVTAFVVLLPVILAAVLPQHPAP